MHPSNCLINDYITPKKQLTVSGHVTLGLSPITVWLPGKSSFYIVRQDNIAEALHQCGTEMIFLWYVLVVLLCVFEGWAGLLGGLGDVLKGANPPPPLPPPPSPSQTLKRVEKIMDLNGDRATRFFQSDLELVKNALTNGKFASDSNPKSDKTEEEQTSISYEVEEGTTTKIFSTTLDPTTLQTPAEGKIPVPVDDGRRIIDAPKKECPKGSMVDGRGQCRQIVRK